MKHLKSFSIFESQEEEDFEEYEITAEDEINGQYCKDFEVANLKVGDKIYHRLIDVDEYSYEWAKDAKKLIPNGLASYGGEPTEYEVVEVGSDTIKLK